MLFKPATSLFSVHTVFLSTFTGAIESRLYVWKCTACITGQGRSSEEGKIPVHTQI